MKNVMGTKAGGLKMVGTKTRPDLPFSIFFKKRLSIQ